MRGRSELSAEATPLDQIASPSASTLTSHAVGSESSTTSSPPLSALISCASRAPSPTFDTEANDLDAARKDSISSSASSSETHSSSLPHEADSAASSVRSSWGPESPSWVASDLPVGYRTTPRPWSLSSLNRIVRRKTSQPGGLSLVVRPMSYTDSTTASASGTASPPLLPSESWGTVSRSLATATTSPATRLKSSASSFSLTGASLFQSHTNPDRVRSSPSLSTYFGAPLSSSTTRSGRAGKSPLPTTSKTLVEEETDDPSSPTTPTDSPRNSRRRESLRAVFQNKLGFTSL